MTDYAGFLLASFRSEQGEHGEQVRFAVSRGAEPTEWLPLNADRPVISSSEGEHGLRDPFLIRDEARGTFVLIATDLRVWPDHDWARAVRHGSRSIAVAESTDLVAWSPPRLVQVSPPEVGNTWAPKAFWSEVRGCWLVFWASAMFSPRSDRTTSEYQRILVAPTADFREFGTAEVYLDRGHDIIDATFLEDDNGQWFRFSADAQSPEVTPDLGHHIFMEQGTALEDPTFTALAIDVGKPELDRGEGPAVARAIDGTEWYLLIDEFSGRGYQLFRSADLTSGRWRHDTAARIPLGTRHGSLLPITADERDRLVAASW